MDPSVCANPTFKTPAPKPNPNLKDVPKSVSQSLKEAALRLKKEMENVEPPQPVIEIKGEVGQCIVVKEEHRPDLKDYLVIYKGSDILYQVEKSVFRHVQFTSLADCRVFVLAKMVRVFFMRCQGCQISIRTPLIGYLEFFKCRGSHVNIRVPGVDLTGPPIPLVLVEECKNFDIFQSNREMVYVVKLCDTVTGTIIDPKTKERKARYSLGKIFWGEQEQTLVLLSIEKGFASVRNEYALNNLNHHLMIKPLCESESDSETETESVEDLFGTTPPVAKSGFLWRKPTS